MSKAIAKAPAPKVSKRGRVGEGRPSKYAAWMLPVVRVLGRLGAILPDLSEALEVAESTVSLWMTESPEFSEAIMAGRDDADDKVERSLFARATGYAHPSEKIFVHKGEVIRAETVKQYPPDTLAMIYWLNNRRSRKWRNKVEVVGGEQPSAGQLTPELVVDGLVAAAQRHPIAREPMIRLLQSALDRLQAIPE